MTKTENSSLSMQPDESTSISAKSSSTSSCGKSRLQWRSAAANSLMSIKLSSERALVRNCLKSFSSVRTSPFTDCSIFVRSKSSTLPNFVFFSVSRQSCPNTFLSPCVMCLKSGRETRTAWPASAMVMYEHTCDATLGSAKMTYPQDVLSAFSRSDTAVTVPKRSIISRRPCSPSSGGTPPTQTAASRADVTSSDSACCTTSVCAAPPRLPDLPSRDNSPPSSWLQSICTIGVRRPAPKIESGVRGRVAPAPSGRSERGLAPRTLPTERGRSIDMMLSRPPGMEPSTLIARWAYSSCWLSKSFHVTNMPLVLATGWRWLTS